MHENIHLIIIDPFLNGNTIVAVREGDGGIHIFSLHAQIVCTNFEGFCYHEHLIAAQKVATASFH